jgi:hypothetical protein
MSAQDFWDWVNLYQAHIADVTDLAVDDMGEPNLDEYYDDLWHIFVTGIGAVDAADARLSNNSHSEKKTSDGSRSKAPHPDRG